MYSKTFLQGNAEDLSFFQKDMTFQTQNFTFSEMYYFKNQNFSGFMQNKKVQITLSLSEFVLNSF